MAASTERFEIIANARASRRLASLATLPGQGGEEHPQSFNIPISFAARRAGSVCR